ncbi:MAG: hypothetical protein QNJ47_17710 [Nostocaceae cyanobacterium]|nr:hypothetical protein [Nostocaceae cyanobacterium]
MTLLYSFKYDYKIQQALQWWSGRQSMRFFREAEKIRNGLLQESFSIRRRLELLQLNNQELSNNTIQELLQKIDIWHQSLVQLSNYLFPDSLEHNLPLAIQLLLEQWLISHSHLYLNLNIPTYWRQEAAERSLIVLIALDELLRITLPEAVIPIFIYLTLKLSENIGQMIVEINYPNVSTLIFYSHARELLYLSASFSFLTSGRCFLRRNNLTLTCNFFW